jgi:hypothetical protein
MPSELRRIVFSNDELRSALEDYLKGQKTPLPLGVITSVQLSDAPQGTVFLYLAGREDNDRASLALSPEKIAAALLRFCKRQRIPVPRRANKSLIVTGDNVALDIRTGAADPAKMEQGSSHG